MATNIKTVTKLGVIQQTGNGVPTHETPDLAYFKDLDTGDRYINVFYRINLCIILA